jgi:hypothetical protein
VNNRGSRRAIIVCAALVVAASVWGSAPRAALAQMTEQQIRDSVEQTYSVQVLKLRAGEIAGKPVFIVTVMNLPGDFNEAFQVSTLAVDAASGKLIPGFRHRPSGLVENQSPSYRTGRQPTDSFRQGFSWR